MFGGAVFLTCMVLVFSPPALAETDSGPTFEEIEIDLQAAALWMLDQPDAVRQAAGLLMQQKLESSSSRTRENPEALEARIAELLFRSKDPLNLALLAAVCNQTGIQNRCIKLGLADAINIHDQGNAISLASLYAEDPDGLQNALLSMQKVDDYIFAIAEVWDRALEDYLKVGRDTERHMLASFQALAIVQAISIPGYSRLSSSCRQETGESAIAMACARISELARHSSNSLILRMIGFGIARERALAAGDEALAEQIGSEQKDLQNRVICIHQQVPESHWRESNDTSSNWIRSAAELGEVGATEALGTHYNVDCPT